jgi:trimeric autotransporter adhesin
MAQIGWRRFIRGPGRLRRRLSRERRVQLWLEPLEDRTLLSAALVKDINTTVTSGSFPSNFVSLGSTAFFFARDGVHGNELWKSDGTNGGTVLVKDIYPGSASAVFDAAAGNALAAVGGQVYFIATDGTQTTLWKSDGTAPGTVKVLDNAAGSGQLSQLANLTNVNGNLFFTAGDSTHGEELWMSDGTGAGTKLVADVNPGSTNGLPDSSSPSNLAALGGTLFFSADDGTHGMELWRTDGTTTSLVADTNPGSTDGVPNGSSPADLAVVGSFVYFAADDGNGPRLWKSDGQSRGTTPVFDLSPGNLTAVGGTLYFTADDGSNGTELWSTDGTTTTLAKDLFPGSVDMLPNSSFPQNLTAAGNQLFFTADDGINGRELWIRDAVGDTHLVRDIRPGPLGGVYNPGYGPGTSMAAAGGTLFFTADAGTTGEELWKSDGTQAGTVLVKDLNSRTDSYPQNPVNVGGTLFFTVNDEVHGTELWQSDGTLAGTKLVRDINTTATGAGSYPSQLTAVGNVLFFIADDGSHGLELWRSNGTDSGTVMVKDLNPGSANGFAGYGYASGATLAALGGILYFAGANGTTGNELWKTDGITTSLVADVNPTSTGGIPAGSWPQDLTVAGTLLYFTADDGRHGRELWKCDGTTTSLVADINTNSTGGIPASSSPQNLTAVGSTLYFTADDGTDGTELWSTDGTTSTLVKDINAGSAAGVPNSSLPQDLTAVGTTLFFTAEDGTHGRELWKSNGTPAGTLLVKDLDTTGEGSSSPSSLTNVGGFLYFAANDGLKGQELWKSDGTPGDTVLVKDIRPGPSGALPLGRQRFAVVGNTFLFVADDGGSGNELWRSDGTAAGTVLVRDLNPGANPGVEDGSGPLVAVGGKVFFQANDGVHGNELWVAGNTPGTLHFGSATYSVSETAGSIEITVTRTGGDDGPLSVLYNVGGGTATVGGNYTGATSGTLDFPDGVTTRTFLIQILNDGAGNGDKTVTLTLSGLAGGGTLGFPVGAILTIADSSPPGPGPGPTTDGVKDVTSQVAVTTGKTSFSAAAKKAKVILTIKNRGRAALTGPLILVLDGLNKKIKFKGGVGLTEVLAPLGSPFVNLAAASLRPGASTTITLVFTNAPRKVKFTARVLAGSGWI